jgi:hypothetical protein
MIIPVETGIHRKNKGHGFCIPDRSRGQTSAK